MAECRFDDDTLQDTLAFMDAFEASGAWSEEEAAAGNNNGETQGANTPAAKPRVRAVSTTNRSRSRLRQELLYLRAKVTQLQEKLFDLQKRSNVQEGVATTALSGYSDHDGSTLVKTRWKAMAQRQLTARERSEHDNARLRLACQRQMRLYATLARLLCRQQTAEAVVIEAADDSADSIGDPVFTVSKVKDKAHVDSALALLRTQYERVDIAMKQNGLDEVEGDSHETTMSVADDGVLVVELRQSHVYPFPAHEVAQAV